MLFASWEKMRSFIDFFKKYVHYRITFKDKSDYKVIKYFKQIE